MSAAEISISSQRDAANTLIVIFSAAIVPVICQHIIFKGYILHFNSIVFVLYPTYNVSQSIWQFYVIFS